jgi:hypothetical protein
VKREKFGQSIWDENVMLLETSWKTHCELDGNNKPSSTQKKNSPIDQAKFLFRKLFVIIFNLT